MERWSKHLAVAMVACTVIATVGWSRVKLQRPTTIDVRGSAKRRIASDLGQWTCQVTVVKPMRVEAYGALRKDVEVVQGFLKGKGVADKDLRVSAVSMVELSHVDTVEEGSKVTRKQVFDGFQLTQQLEVATTDVGLVERLSREATQLLERGVVITSESPRYHYTKVGELKIEMLAEASRDARQRAERMLGAAGGGASVGRVEGIDTGVININPANGTDTSWEGNYDTTSFEKDMLTTVRVRFEVRN